MNLYLKNICYLLETHPDAYLEGLSIDFKINPTTGDLLLLSSLFHYSIDDLIKRDIATEKDIQTNKIKMIVLDVDGVMTDGGMYYTEAGDEFKKYNTKDGMAIKKMVEKGMNFGIISSGFNANLIKRRAELLGIQKVHVGREAKLPTLKAWCEEKSITLKEVAYIGDDINDLELFSNVGLCACPSDAVQVIREKAHVILSKKGGEGCIREFIDRYFDY